MGRAANRHLAVLDCMRAAASRRLLPSAHRRVKSHQADEVEPGHRRHRGGQRDDRSGLLARWNKRFSW